MVRRVPEGVLPRWCR